MQQQEALEHLTDSQDKTERAEATTEEKKPDVEEQKQDVETAE